MRTNSAPGMQVLNLCLAGFRGLKLPATARSKKLAQEQLRIIVRREGVMICKELRGQARCGRAGGERLVAKAQEWLKREADEAVD